MTVKRYTTMEVADQMRVTRRTVYDWMRAGLLTGHRVGSSWRFTEGDLQAFLQRSARTADAKRAEGSEAEESKPAAKGAKGAKGGRRK